MSNLDAKSWTAERISKLISTADAAQLNLPPSTVERMLAKARIKTFTKGAVIVQRDVAKPKFCLSLSGKVRLTSSTADGREFISVLLEPGNFWGLHPSLEDEPDTHDAIAEETCEILTIEPKDLRELMWQDRDFQTAMVKVLCCRLRLALNVMNQLATWSPRERLAWRIVNLVEINGIKASKEARIVISVSQDIMASMVALSRQRTNKILKEFEAEGMLKIEYGKIVVLDMAALGNCYQQ